MDITAGINMDHFMKKPKIKKYEDKVLEREIENAKSYNPLHGKHRTMPYYELEKELQIQDELEKQLEVKKAQDKEAQNEIEKRWKDAEAKVSFVQKILPKYEEYFKACQRKRETCLKRYTEERGKIQEMDKEIQRLNWEKSILYKVQETQYKRVEVVKPVKEYLESERDLSNGDFQDLDDFLWRYELLKNIKKKLLYKSLGRIDDLMQIKQNLREIKEEKSSEHMTYSNHKTELDQLLNRLKVKAVDLDGKLLNLKTQNQERCLLIGKLKMAVYSLYLNFCNQMQRNPQIKSGHSIHQLKYLQKYLGDLLNLCKELHRSEDTGSDQATAHNSDREKKCKLEEFRKSRDAKNLDDNLVEEDLIRLLGLSPLRSAGSGSDNESTIL